AHVNDYRSCHYLSTHVVFIDIYSFVLFTVPSSPLLYSLSLHDALPISSPATPHLPPSTNSPPAPRSPASASAAGERGAGGEFVRSEEHTSELQSLRHLVCRLLLEKKKKTRSLPTTTPAGTTPSPSPIPQ